MDNFNAGIMARQRIPLPQFDEQLKVVSLISDDTDQVNTAISRLVRDIELVREYRTRLVADFVNGKLEVREAAAHLPTEATQEPAEDDIGLDPSLDPSNGETIIE